MIARIRAERAASRLASPSFWTRDRSAAASRSHIERHSSRDFHTIAIRIRVADKFNSNLKKDKTIRLVRGRSGASERATGLAPAAFELEVEVEIPSDWARRSIDSSCSAMARIRSSSKSIKGYNKKLYNKKHST